MPRLLLVYSSGCPLSVSSLLFRHAREVLTGRVSVAKARHVIARLVMPPGKVRVSGRTLVVPAEGSGTSGALLWQPSWKTALIRDFLGRRPGAFVDVGTNVGQTLFDFLDAAPGRSYVGFEPNPACAYVTGEVIRRNRLSDCSLVSVGLGEEAALLRFYTPTGYPADAGATFVTGLRPTLECDEHVVPVFPFDTAWKALGGGPVSLIKVDVEGAELDVLRGMSQFFESERAPILMEVLSADRHADFDAYAAKLDAVERLLSEADYRIHAVHKEGRTFRLEPAATFPRRLWTPEVAEADDYLVAPAEGL